MEHQLRRIALLSDLHGNLTATRAVLADAKTRSVTDYAVLGDLLMPGPGTQELLDLLHDLHPLVWLTGNWEQLLFAVNEDQIDPKRPNNVYFAILADYVMRRLRPGQLQELHDNPISAMRTINGLHIGFSHNERDFASGHDLYPDRQQENFDRLFAPGQDIAVYGHIHQEMLRTSSKGQLIINPGAVGQPYSPWRPIFRDQRASYAILQITPEGYTDLEFHHVAYDVEAEIKLAADLDLPYLPLYRHLRRTGRTITHNQHLLAKFNAAWGYDKAVLKLLK